MFKPIKPKRVYAEIVDQIQELIHSGHLKPGDKISAERELAEQLQVSRASIREAFSALDLMGILESRPGEGTFIRAVSPDEIIKPLALMLLLEKESSYDIMEVRRILEVESASLAAQRATAGNLDRMREHLAEMEEDLRRDRIGEVPDAQFHCAIAEASRNKVLARLMHTMSDLLVCSMKLSRQKMFMIAGNREKLLAQHRAIYEAIAAREPRAARLKMGAHLDFVSREIFALATSCSAGAPPERAPSRPEPANRRP